MIKIEIDQEVFEILEKNAKPFTDTPNTVLRRLLQIDKAQNIQKNEDKSAMATPIEKTSKIDSNEFVHTVLKNEFTEEFWRKSPYRYMFESANSLIYFQNFNKESATLWYRVNEKPYSMLKKSEKESDKKSYICLTNPAEGKAYLIPLEDIEKQVRSLSWERDYLEINIDHVSGKWKELNWNIKQYLRTY